MKDAASVSPDKQLEIYQPKLAPIPGGEFCMGCELGRADEKPVHRVWVDAFAMGTTTVTNEQYLEFVREAEREMPKSFFEERFGDPLQPVVGITWFDAVAYCDWLTQKGRRLFRLPTEAEWEWAIRAGSESKLYAWGDENPEALEFYRTGWQDERPHVVGLREPNTYGLYDIGDNVHEWCLDWYQADFYQRSPSRNPVNLTPNSRRASRGGSWRHHIKVSRCAARSSLPPSFGYTDYGFRVVTTDGKYDLAWM
jgi:sulfatase modifying factor 1